jgi:hypothetical protein
VRRLLFVAALLLFGLLLRPGGPLTLAGAECDPLGWYPKNVSLKDHSVFFHDGFFYIVSIDAPQETSFAYARSADLCLWEQQEPILADRTPGDWDEYKIWSPFVLEANGTYFLFYTGVNQHIAQSIMLATTTDPTDPDSWQEQGMVFQPSHSGAVWSPNSWSDNRDPVVIADGGLYYLYYTGRDSAGGIVGAAVANALVGPWTDLGATLGPIPGRILESPMVFSEWGGFYLAVHETLPGQSLGAQIRSGNSPTGPWGNPSPLFPGWAHEFWQDPALNWHASYLTTPDITIEPVGWLHDRTPPRPFLGDALFEIHLPLLTRD